MFRHGQCTTPGDNCPKSQFYSHPKPKPHHTISQSPCFISTHPDQFPTSNTLHTTSQQDAASKLFTHPDYAFKQFMLEMGGVDNIGKPKEHAVNKDAIGMLKETQHLDKLERRFQKGLKAFNSQVCLEKGKPSSSQQVSASKKPPSKLQKKERFAVTSSKLRSPAKATERIKPSLSTFLTTKDRIKTKGEKKQPEYLNSLQQRYKNRLLRAQEKHQENQLKARSKVRG